LTRRSRTSTSAPVEIPRGRRLAFQMRPMTGLLERHAEVDARGRTVAAAEEGRGAVAVVLGEAGAGKTPRRRRSARSSRLQRSTEAGTAVARAGATPVHRQTAGARTPRPRGPAGFQTLVDRADSQPGRRGRRRGRSRGSSSVARRRRCFSSRASCRSSLSPTSRNNRSTAAPSPRVISAMASTSPVNPLTRAAQIGPATTSAAADPNARTRGRGATAPRYRFDSLPSGSQSPGTRVPLRATCGSGGHAT
jgi:hypothetical protein